MSPKNLRKNLKLLKILTATAKQNDSFNFLLDKYELHKVLKISAWITRFINNFERNMKKRILTTSEIQCQEKFYIKREKRKVEHSEKLEDSRKWLNLQLNCENIYERRARVQGVYPIYLSSISALSKKIIISAYRKTLHRVVASTMAAARSLFWIPVLRKLTKSVIRNCYGCKRFRETLYPDYKPMILPRNRTE